MLLDVLLLPLIPADLCHLHPIWPTGLPLNITHILWFLCNHNEWTHHTQTSHVPCNKCNAHFPYLRSSIQRICPDPRLFVTFCNKFISYGKLLAPHPTHRCRITLYRLLATAYSIYSQLPHLWAISSSHNLKICHAVMIGDPPHLAFHMQYIF